MKRTTRKHPRGLALIEVMICATIAAMLLTATAVAFRASVMTYRDNTDRNMLVSQGRTAMRQLMQDIRQSDVQQPVNDAANPNAVTQFLSGVTVECSSIELVKEHADADDPGVVPGAANASTWADITWSYDPVKKQILRSHRIGATAGTTTVMANYVQSFAVSQTPQRSQAHVAAGDPNYDLLYRAAATITMRNVDTSGGMLNTQGSTVVTERLIDAAVPRRNFSDIR